MRGTRRSFLESAAALLAAAILPAQGAARASRTRLILLGTGGGPRPRPGSVATAQAIVANDTVYVVDCGDGAARQLVTAEIALDRLRHVFVTHHHSDHRCRWRR